MHLCRPVYFLGTDPGIWVYVMEPYTKSNIQQLGAVQRGAARFVTGDYRTTTSPSQMIAHLGWEPLYQQRANFKLKMVYCQSSHLLLICSPELPLLVLGLLLFEGDYILLYGGTPTFWQRGLSFWQRGLWDSCFQNPQHSSATVPTSISIEHSRPHSALHDSLLQDRCLPKFIFPISNQAVHFSHQQSLWLWNQLLETIQYCSCPNP